MKIGRRVAWVKPDKNRPGQVLNYLIMRLNVSLLPEWEARVRNHEGKMSIYDSFGLIRNSGRLGRMREEVKSVMAGITAHLGSLPADRSDLPVEQVDKLLSWIDRVRQQMARRAQLKKHVAESRNYPVRQGLRPSFAFDRYLSGESNEALQARWLRNKR
jgi:hypothetical protein